MRQIKNHGFPPVDMGGEIIHGCYTKVYQLAKENEWDLEMVVTSVFTHIGKKQQP